MSAPFRAALSGAVATSLAWFILQAIVGFSKASGPARSHLNPSHLVAGYVGSLFIAGLCAGVFGGMTAAVVGRPRRLVTAFLYGLLGPFVLSAACAITYHLWGWPQMAEHVETWAPFLVACGGVGGSIGFFLNPRSPAVEREPVSVDDEG